MILGKENWLKPKDGFRLMLLTKRNVRAKNDRRAKSFLDRAGLFLAVKIQHEII